MASRIVRLNLTVGISLKQRNYLSTLPLTSQLVPLSSNSDPKNAAFCDGSGSRVQSDVDADIMQKQQDTRSEAGQASRSSLL
jgi:hypothetical protein